MLIKKLNSILNLNLKLTTVRLGIMKGELKSKISVLQTL